MEYTDEEEREREAEEGISTADTDITDRLQDAVDTMDPEPDAELEELSALDGLGNDPDQPRAFSDDMAV